MQATSAHVVMELHENGTSWGEKEPFIRMHGGCFRVLGRATGSCLSYFDSCFIFGVEQITSRLWISDKMKTDFSSLEQRCAHSFKSILSSSWTTTEQLYLPPDWSSVAPAYGIHKTAYISHHCCGVSQTEVLSWILLKWKVSDINKVHSW